MTIAFWCVFVAIILPYVLFGIAAVAGGTQRDNLVPRDFFHIAQGKAKRALGAHLNTFETNIGFIAGVIIATLAHVPQGRIDLIAMLYIVFRVLFALLYLLDKGALRSVAWAASFGCVVALFLSAA